MNGKKNEELLYIINKLKEIEKSDFALKNNITFNKEDAYSTLLDEAGKLFFMSDFILSAEFDSQIFYSCDKEGFAYILKTIAKNIKRSAEILRYDLTSLELWFEKKE